MTVNVPFEIRLTNSLTDWDGQCTYEDPTTLEQVALNLTGRTATVTVINTKDFSATAITNDALTVVDAATGRVRYVFNSADFSSAGIYALTVTVTEAGKSASYPVRLFDMPIWVHGVTQTAQQAHASAVAAYASIDSNGVLQLKRGLTSTLTFTSESLNPVSDLSVANTKVFLGIKDQAGRTWLKLEGTVLVATGLQSVRFVLTPTLSLALIKGHHNFDVIAVYGYDVSLTPPYASLSMFKSGRVTVTDVYLDPLEL